MSKFNATKEKIVPTEVNEMGSAAYKLLAKEELLATCLTSFLTNSYYETEVEVTNRIKQAIEDTPDTEFIAKLAIYLRKNANMRSVSHLLAGELAGRLSGKPYAARFYENVSQRPDDMSEILAYYFATKGSKIPNAIKRGFKAKLESMDPYLIDKYKMKSKEISLIDLVNLFHPAPNNMNDVAYSLLMKGESLEGTYKSKIFEKEMTDAGKKAKDSGFEVDKLKGEVIKEMLDSEKGMNMFTLVRNLSNIMNFAPSEIDSAIEQLTTKEKVLKSKLLPFRFATAYEEVSKSFVTKDGGIKFEQSSSIKDKVLKALEVALGYSILNIPKLAGTTAVLVDHSGSVRGDSAGSGSISAFSKTTTAMIGNLLGSMMVYSQDNVYFGMFGDNLISVPIDRNMGVLEFNKYSFDLGSKCGASTEKGIFDFLKQAIDTKSKVDNLIIFSDMVIGDGYSTSWYGSKHNFQDLMRKFKQINPQCQIISVDIRQTSGKSVTNKSLGITQVSGWSEKIFDIIETNCKGYGQIIKEIESIEL